MNLVELQQTLEEMSERELSRFVKRCICHSFTGESIFPEIDTGVALDMVHSECIRRGIEKLYDMAQESVTKNPGVCDAA